MQELINLDQQATLWINGSHSLFWDNLMMTVTNTFAWSLLIVMLLYVICHNNQMRDVLLIFLLLGLMVFVADRICSGMVKPMVARWRPTQDPQLMYLIDTVDGYRGGRYGFFSGHASNTFCVATFLVLLFRQSVLSFVIYLWAATTTFTRLYLGVHYLGDVLVGAVFGVALGLLFHLLYRWLVRHHKEEHVYVSGQFTSSGYLVLDLRRFLMVIFLNYILVVIVSLIHF